MSAAVLHIGTASAEPLLQRLEGVQRQGDGWRARCPACGGTSRKVSISEREGRVLLHCFGCNDAEAVLTAVGLRWADIMPPRTWPPSPQERESYRRAQRDAGLAAAVDVLALEGAVIANAAQMLADWPILGEPDNDRLALACDRIGGAAAVLTNREAFRPDWAYPPARLVHIKRRAVNELRRQLAEAETALAAAIAALEAQEAAREQA